MLLFFLSFITWNPSREAFTVPFFDIAIYWYSLFFALGCLGAYLFVLHTLGSTYDKKRALAFTDTLLAYTFVGMLLGARLGHVFFYDWQYFKDHLTEIIMIRQGGLASHGGAVGILVGFILFWKYHAKDLPGMSWRRLLDYITTATCFTAGCIRIGNFFNQEIIGTPSNAPWAVLFGHPTEAGVAGPRHPVQLYEAIFYFGMFGILWYLSHRQKYKAGLISGIFFLAIFLFRFFIEWIKIPQESIPLEPLTMGQLLSIPFILLSLYFFISKEKKIV